MPAAGYVRASADGGQMKGGAPRVVWMTLGADPKLISAHSAAERLNQFGRPPHLVWNPVTGDVVQLIPVVRAALALNAAAGLDQEAAADGYQAGPLAAAPSDGSSAVHTEGRLCVQIGVVGQGWAPFTAGPVTGLEAIMDWLDSWDISRRWPAGCPAAFGHAHTTQRSRRLWARGGHFGASQVPCCVAAGPGAIDVQRLTGAADGQPGGVPRPRSAAPAQRRPAPVRQMDRVRAGSQPAEALAGVG
jgi:hypothetical protein